MITIICVGDSITEGIGASDTSYSYVSELQTLLGNDYRVCNFGRNGATLVEPPNGKKDNYLIQPQFSAALKEVRKSEENGNEIIVSIMLGTNDADIIDYGFPADSEVFDREFHEKFISEYLNIIESFRNISNNISFIISISPYSYDSIKHTSFGNLGSVWKFQKEVVEICMVHGIKVVINDMASATSPDTIGEAGIERYYRDMLHPNDVGHMYFAHFFNEAVRNLKN